MPTMFRSTLTALLLLGACADMNADPNATQDELADEAPDGEDFPRLRDQVCIPQPPRQCPVQRVPEGYTEIHAKRDQLHPDLRDQYFDADLSEVGTTPDGLAHYKWFTGLAGRGAIYNLGGSTYVIYGPVLDAWEAASYERGHLGYMEGDPEVDVTAAQPNRNYVARQEFEPETYAPEPENGGLQTVRHFLVPNGTTAEDREVREYLSSGTPRVPALEPQTCEYLEIDFIPQDAMGRWAGDGLLLWCGPKYWEEDGYEPPFNDGLI